jgi:four helix bundle protein
MFSFEKLKLYPKAKKFHVQIRNLIHQVNLDFSTRDQLSRASLSVVLNLAEGSGRFSSKDQRHFFVMSRSSLFETVAILDVLKDSNIISIETFGTYHKQAEELSVAIYAMIKRLS